MRVLLSEIDVKKKKFTLQTETDIKVFLLFLLEYIREPVDRATLIDIVSENTDEILINYDACLESLVDSEHIFPDEIDGERYYIITDSGRMVAKELFDTLDPEFREKSLKTALKHLSLTKRGMIPRVRIEETEKTRYKVTMTLSDAVGEIFTLTLNVPSLGQAEEMKRYFETNPEGVYRGVFFSACGKFDYLFN